MDKDVVLEGMSSLLGVPVSRVPKRGRHGGRRPSRPVLPVQKFMSSMIDRSSLAGELHIDEEEFFDSKYDYDFRDLTDTTACVRGNEPYKRPAGWYRVALRVRWKYPDGNTWLGPEGWRSRSAWGEWPVSFHGTSIDGAKGIIQEGYRAGDGNYGRGVYSTPDIEMAEDYAAIFTSKKTGQTYKVVLQNRVNRRYREICERPDYWLVPVPEGTSPEEERDIVGRAIRPYGLLFKEVQ
ncbi:uncharacterized protein LOC134460216 isoform X2 [Engraulis encrasicolus]|uniref:uncharacterized protein LOC134460216 isoform X2 n=1 Tax=Engraulis encrasicolus TaxID=184585 RepID=UPI002FD67B17